jgi:crossover junction endodeoxyribonuclease RuvC
VLVGFDPGSQVTGYGVLQVQERDFRVLEYGCITTRKASCLAEKLEQIYGDAEAIIREYQPEEVIVERAFYAKNVKVTLILGHVRGVLLLAARKAGAHVIELSPREIKRFVTGNGAASKDKVKYMVSHILNLKSSPKANDASDALAAALAHGLSVTRG